MRINYKKLATVLIGLTLVAGLPLISLAQKDADITLPSDVENVKAIGGDKEVVLTWDQSTDNVGVTGYKIYMGLKPVADGSQDYDLPTVEVKENVKEYKVQKLENGTAYYFAMTSLDAAGNESEYYSDEVSATPTAPPEETPVTTTDDKIAPTVVSSVALSNTSAQIVFSEAVTLPAQAAETAFNVKNQADNKPLVIIAAQIDSKDAGGKTVVLTTEPQTDGISYVLTVGIAIKDKAGNPIISGTADTASFKGSTAEEAPKDTEKPKLSTAKALSSEKIEVTFSEPIISGDDSASKFKIYESADEKLTLAVLTAEMSDDPSIVLLTTEKQAPQTEYVLEVTGIGDKSGNLIQPDGFESTAVFTSNAADLGDLIPPEEVTNFIAAAIKTTMVKLTWTASVNSAGDLADQILYQSLDRGTTYDQGQSLGKDVTKYEIKGLTPNKEYTFKLTVRDKTGNESKGLTTTVKTLSLPQTGPGALALAITAALGGASWIFKKKK